MGVKRGEFRHGITFHNYRFHVHTAAAPAEPGECVWVPLERLSQLPVSTVFRKALKMVRLVAAVTA